MRENRTSQYRCKECGHKWSGFELRKNQIKKFNIICERCESNNIEKIGLKFNNIFIYNTSFRINCWNNRNDTFL